MSAFWKCRQQPETIDLASADLGQCDNVNYLHYYERDL